MRTLHLDQKIHNLVLKCQNTQQNGVFYGLTLYLLKALFNIILLSTLRSSNTNFIVVVFFSLCLAVIFSFDTLHMKYILIYTLIFSARNALTEMHSPETNAVFSRVNNVTVLCSSPAGSACELPLKFPSHALFKTVESGQLIFR